MRKITKGFSQAMGYIRRYPVASSITSGLLALVIVVSAVILPLDVTRAAPVANTITMYPTPGVGGVLTGELNPDLLTWASTDHPKFDKAYTKVSDNIDKYTSSGTYSDKERIAYSYPTGTSGYYNGYVTDKHVIVEDDTIRFLGYQVEAFMDKIFTEGYPDAFDSMSFTMTPSNLNYHTFSETGFLFNGTFASNGNYTGYMLLLKNSSSSNTGTASLQLVYVNNGAMNTTKYAPSTGARTVLGTYKTGIQNRDNTPINVLLERDPDGAFRLYVDGVLVADVENPIGSNYGFGFFTGYFSHNCPILSVVQYDNVKFMGTFPSAQGDIRVEFYNIETGTLIDADPQLESDYVGTRYKIDITDVQTLSLPSGTWEYVESDPVELDGLTIKGDETVIKLYYYKPSDIAFKTATVDGEEDKGTANDPVRVSPDSSDPLNEIDYRVDLVNPDSTVILAGTSYSFDIGTGKDITTATYSDGTNTNASTPSGVTAATSWSTSGFQNAYGTGINKYNQSLTLGNTSTFDTPATLAGGTYYVEVTMSVTGTYPGAFRSLIMAATAVDGSAPGLATGTGAPANPTRPSPTLTSETTIRAWGSVLHDFGTTAPISNTGFVTYRLPDPIVIPTGSNHYLSLTAGFFALTSSQNNDPKNTTVIVSQIKLVPIKFTLTDTLPQGVELVTPYNFRYTDGAGTPVNVNLSAGYPTVITGVDGRQTITWEFGTLFGSGDAPPVHDGTTSFHFLTTVTGNPDPATEQYINSAVFNDVRTGLLERTNKTYHTAKFKVTEMFHPYQDPMTDLKKPNIYLLDPGAEYLPGRTVYDNIQKYDGADFRAWRYYGYSLDDDPSVVLGRPDEEVWDERDSSNPNAWNMIDGDHTLHLYFVEDVKVTVYYYEEGTTNELKDPAVFFAPAYMGWNLAVSHKNPITDSSSNIWNYVGYEKDDGGGYITGDYPVGYTYDTIDMDIDHEIILYFTQDPSVRVRFREYSGNPGAPDRGVVLLPDQNYIVVSASDFEPMTHSEISVPVVSGLIRDFRELTYAGYSVDGGPFIADDPPEDYLNVISNHIYTLYFTSQYVITEMFHGNDRTDDTPATVLVPPVDTMYGGGEEYIGNPPMYLSDSAGNLWKYFGYVFTDDPIDSSDEPDGENGYDDIDKAPAVPGIPAVWSDETIIFIYEPCESMPNMKNAYINGSRVPENGEEGSPPVRVEMQKDDEILYTIEFYNDTPNAALTVTDIVPKGLLVDVPNISDDGTYDSGMITWTLSAVPKGIIRLSFPVTVKTGGDYDNTAHIIRPDNSSEPTNTTYHYMESSTVLLHVRQVVLDPNSDVSLPLMGYLRLVDDTAQLQLPATCFSGTNDSTDPYSDYLLSADADPEYSVFLIVPQNYSFAGSLVTNESGLPHDKIHLDDPATAPNGQILLNFSDDGELWLTLYIKPINDPPRDYSDSYATNDFGNISA